MVEYYKETRSMWEEQVEKALCFPLKLWILRMAMMMKLYHTVVNRKLPMAKKMSAMKIMISLR